MPASEHRDLVQFISVPLIPSPSSQVVGDIPSPLPPDLPMVLVKPKEACPTAEVYKAMN